MATTLTIPEVPGVTFTVTVGGTDPLTQAQLPGGYITVVGIDDAGDICYRFGGNGGIPMPPAVADNTTPQPDSATSDTEAIS